MYNKKVLDISSTLLYNLLRKVFGIEVSDCPLCDNLFGIASTFWAGDAISFC